MSNDNIISLKQPEQNVTDALTALLRNGAKELINQAVQAELEELLSQHSDVKVDGKQAVVRNGYLGEPYRQGWVMLKYRCLKSETRASKVLNLIPC